MKVRIKNMEKVIAVQIIGGLGNQMFQYALAKKLSILNDNAPILLDISLFDKYFRKYELSKFDIKASLADKETLFKLETGTLPLFIGKIIDLIPYMNTKDLIRKPFSKVYREVGVNFHSDVLNIKDSIYIKGNWASYKYFWEIRELLLEDLAFKEYMNDENMKVTDQIKNSKNSVSLHIRRGDYLKPVNQKIYCSPLANGFYQHAISEIEKRIENPEFFVFSDDPNWVKDNFKINHKFNVIDINKGDNSYWDMKLMSICKHNIIANSTFSWWAACLNENPSKIVYAPKLWMNDPTFKIEDLIPPEWVML